MATSTTIELVPAPANVVDAVFDKISLSLEKFAANMNSSPNIAEVVRFCTFVSSNIAFCAAENLGMAAALEKASDYEAHLHADKQHLQEQNKALMDQNKALLDAVLAPARASAQPSIDQLTNLNLRLHADNTCLSQQLQQANERIRQLEAKLHATAERNFVPERARDTRPQVNCSQCTTRFPLSHKFSKTGTPLCPTCRPDAAAAPAPTASQ